MRKTKHSKQNFFLHLNDKDIGDFFKSRVENYNCIFESVISSNFKIELLNQTQINTLYNQIFDQLSTNG